MTQEGSSSLGCREVKGGVGSKGWRRAKESSSRNGHWIISELGCGEEFGEIFPEVETWNEKPRGLRMGPSGKVFIQ